MKKDFCDKCNKEFKPTQDNIAFIRFGHREIQDKELCDACILLFEQHTREFFNHGS